MLDVVIYRTPAPWAEPWLDAMVEGLGVHGIQPEQRPAHDVRQSDLAIIWSHRQRVLFSQQKIAGGHYIVMERGYVGDRLGEWTSLGFDGLNGRAVFPDGNMDRWDQFHSDHLRPWRDTPRGGKRRALLVGQVPGDASLINHSHETWLHAMCTALREAGWDVLFRPHPVACKMNGGDWRRAYGSVPASVSTRDLSDDLDWADATVAWNSNVSVLSVLAGVPAYVYDPRGSMAGAMSRPVITDPPATPDRSDWCRRLAWAQWRIDEIQSGEAWAALSTCDLNSAQSFSDQSRKGA